MRVIDAHLHVLDASWIPEGVRRAWARQAAGRRHPERDPEELLDTVSLGESDPDAERTVAAFDRAGVDGGVVPIVDWTIVGQPCGTHLPIRELHARHHELSEAHPDRLYWCAGLDPRHDDAPAILDDALASRWCVGAKLYPPAGWAADDERHAWAWATLRDRGLPAVVHTAPLGGDPLITPLSRPAALAPVLARHPDLTLVMAHAGFEAWWEEALEIAHGWRRTYLEISLWQRLADRDYGEFRRRLARVIGLLGVHRVIVGSDTIRGPKRDPDGDDLIRLIDQVTGLAEPWQGQPPVVDADGVAMLLGANADRVYRLREDRP